MDFGEMAAVSLISTKHDDDCYFCKNLPKRDRENDFNNDSGKLRDNLNADSSEAKMSPEICGFKSHNMRSGDNAHHLIPADASFANHDVKPALGTHGTSDENAGYDVNGRPNGVFLPAWEAGPVAADKDAKYEFAFAVMDEIERQFHTAHSDYSVFVTEALDKIDLKLTVQKVWCEEDTGKKKKDPLVGLVARLHTLSSRLRKLLTTPVSGWKLNVYTSSYAREYMNLYDIRDELDL